jgi:YD repeat-containing protein
MTSDAMGNLVTVAEPDPVSGTQVTTYTHNAANQLLTVTMPRSGGTQTRSFQWTGSDMTSATNPENGTVTYTYDGAHRVKSKIDAKGQKTQYTDDGYGRKTLVQHFNSSQVEQMNQRVNYTFGDNSGAPAFSLNAWGRLAAVAFSSETTGTLLFLTRISQQSLKQTGQMPWPRIAFFIGCRFPLLLIPELSGRNRPSKSQKTVWGAFSVVEESISGAPRRPSAVGFHLKSSLRLAACQRRNKIAAFSPGL